MPTKPRLPTARKRAPSTEVVTLASPPISIAPGEMIAEQFTLVELYGAGPLGYTYRAKDVADSSVAVKIIAREIAPTGNERIKVVAAASQLLERDMSHVAVPIDVGTHAGVAYVVAPWIRGKSLRRILGAYRDAGRVMPHEEVRGVLEGVVHALRELHTVTAHGALYPESIQVSVDGQVILTDAAIAGALSRARMVEHYERFPDVSPYIPPEVVAGKPSSAGGDLYALGVLASELLTGDPATAATGIAGATLKGFPSEVRVALETLTASKASRRAAGLPVLLAALAKAIREKRVPMTSALPVQKGRTEVMPVVKVPQPRTQSRKRDG